MTFESESPVELDWIQFLSEEADAVVSDQMIELMEPLPTDDLGSNGENTEREMTSDANTASR